MYVGLHGVDGKGGRVGAAGVPRDYAGILLADSPAATEQAKVYAKLDAYVKSFEKHFDDVQSKLAEAGKTDEEIRVKSLYLWSESPGTGKTTTAIALLHEWLLRVYIGYLKRKQTPPQRLGYFLDANGLQTDYNNFNRPKVPDSIAEPAAERYYSSLEKARHTPFVVMDDIGTRDATEGFRDDLRSVINHRVMNEMPTIYTSNIPISELHTVYNQASMVDRIRDMTSSMHFTGESKRGARR
ncbi:DNA replication protein [Bacillus sp. 7894-2]|nr:DNA replication protein [Bacillus sp. 7894-2]